MPVSFRDEMSGVTHVYDLYDKKKQLRVIDERESERSARQQQHCLCESGRHANAVLPKGVV